MTLYRKNMRWAKSYLLYQMCNIMKIVIYMIILVFLISCQAGDHHDYSAKQNERNPDIENENKASRTQEYIFPNGTYCATVEYHHPNTESSNCYTLEVTITHDKLVKIHWPDGERLDESHFTAEDISSGTCSFTSDKGYNYNITIIGKSCRFTESYDHPTVAEQSEIIK